jgi:hypothetical protein
MTQMSEPRTLPATAARANRATARGSFALARPLHGSTAIRALALAIAMMFAGCVIPPSLSVDTTDAGLNSPPSITSVRADGVELPEFSQVTFEQGFGTLNLIVYDTDLDDTLYPKVFVDYKFDDPKPARAPCTAASGRTVQRTSTCDLGALCQVGDIGNQTPLNMQVLVFDRQIIEGQAPIFQAMPPGGLSTSRTFFLKCVARQSP